MGNMRQVSFPRTQGRIAVIILKKRCVDAFSQEVGKMYESSKVEGFKWDIRRHLRVLIVCCSWWFIFVLSCCHETTVALYIRQNRISFGVSLRSISKHPLDISLNYFDEFKFFSLKRLKIDGFLNEKSKHFLSGDHPKLKLQPKFHAKIWNQSFL